MGIFRWVQASETKDIIKILDELPSRDMQMILLYVFRMEEKIKSEFGVDVMEILDSENFNMAENSDWGLVPAQISTGMHVGLTKRYFKDRDTSAFPDYIGTSIILHSIRAVIDLEFNGNKKLLFLCQTMWYILAQGEKDLIPNRFK